MSAIISFGGGVVMARLLDPHDFGLFAAVSAYTALLGRQIQFGIPEALLRTEENDMTAIHAGFWGMAVLSVVCFSLIVICSPFLADFYGDQSYSTVMTTLSLVFLLQPFCYAAQTELRRSMRHDIVSHIMMLSTLLGVLLSVIVAALGFGVYSFVVGGITSAVVLLIGTMKYSRWKPSLEWDRKYTKKLFSYGWRVHVANSLSIASNKVDAILIGKSLDFSSLGIYRRADSTSKLPVTELLGRLYFVIFSLFGGLTDKNEERSAFRKIGTAVLIPIFISLSWLWISMEEFILFLYGDKWAMAVPYAKILVIASALLSLRGFIGIYLSSSGYAGKQMGLAFFDLMLTFCLVSIGLFWGLEGVSWAIVIRCALLLVVSVIVLNIYSNVKLVDFLESVSFPLIAFILSLILGALWLEDMTDIVGGVVAMIFNILFLFLFYALVLYGFWRLFPNNDGLRSFFWLIKDVFASKVMAFTKR